MKGKVPFYSVFALLLVVGILLLLSLNREGESGQGGSKYRPESTGAKGEMVLVCQKKDTLIGDEVQTFLTAPIHGLPRPESRFDVIRVKQKAFGELLQKHRNIFMIDRSSEYDHPAKLSVGTDEWASDQLMLRLTGNDADSMIHKVLDNSSSIIARVNEAERKRLARVYADDHSKPLREKLIQEHGISLTIPEGFSIKKKGDRFVWIEQYRRIPVGGRKRDLMEGILVYYYPYEGEKQFEKEALLEKRDSVLKKYIPGPSEGSYMTTEDRFPELVPKLDERSFNGNYAAELRGLWRVENDQMGGPFISLSSYDKERGRLVTVEGFVYGPRFDKREYVRRLRAMIYSLEFTGSASS